MDKLKLYAAPLVALLLILVWFFVVQPMVGGDEQPADEQGAKNADGKKPQ